MSLDQLRDLRRGGHRPKSVNVIIGKAPKHFEDGPDKVVVSRTDMDLSPLLGIPVHVIDLQEDANFTLAIVAALEAVDVKPLGVCGPYGACGSSPEHEHAMESYRRSLCTRA